MFIHSQFRTPHLCTTFSIPYDTQWYSSRLRLNVGGHHSSRRHFRIGLVPSLVYGRHRWSHAKPFSPQYEVDYLNDHDRGAVHPDLASALRWIESVARLGFTLLYEFSFQCFHCLSFVDVHLLRPPIIYNVDDGALVASLIYFKDDLSNVFIVYHSLMCTSASTHEYIESTVGVSDLFSNKGSTSA